MRCVLAIHGEDVRQGTEVNLYEICYIGICADWLKYALQAFNFLWQTSISPKSKSSMLLLPIPYHTDHLCLAVGLLSATQTRHMLCCTRFSIPLLYFTLLKHSRLWGGRKIKGRERCRLGRVSLQGKDGMKCCKLALQISTLAWKLQWLFQVLLFLPFHSKIILGSSVFCSFPPREQAEGWGNIRGRVPFYPEK